MSFFERVREDIRSVLERDPAARSKFEILTCYPGLWAVWIHRISHALWLAKLRLLARMLSQVGRFFTGVDIHPGALLGRQAGEVDARVLDRGGRRRQGELGEAIEVPRLLNPEPGRRVVLRLRGLLQQLVCQRRPRYGGGSTHESPPLCAHHPA